MLLQYKLFSGVGSLPMTMFNEGFHMSKSELIHELYEQCKDLNFDDTYQLIKYAKSEEEREFLRVVTDCILQQKQKRVIRENKF